jgi:hypothetical protein
MVFDDFAAGLRDVELADEVRERVLALLIGVLQDNDWDTEFGSLCQFRDDPVVVRAFATRGVAFVAGGTDGGSGLAWPWPPERGRPPSAGGSAPGTPR